MYFPLAGTLASFHLLRYGLALILIFVGLKMSWLNAAWTRAFPNLDIRRCDRWNSRAPIGLSLVFRASRAPKDLLIIRPDR